MSAALSSSCCSCGSCLPLPPSRYLFVAAVLTGTLVEELVHWRRRPPIPVTPTLLACGLSGPQGTVMEPWHRQRLPYTLANA